MGWGGSGGAGSGGYSAGGEGLAAAPGREGFAAGPGPKAAGGYQHPAVPCPAGTRNCGRLASSLNEELRLLRKERLRYQQGDRELKEAVVNVLPRPAHPPDGPLRLCGAAKRRGPVPRRAAVPGPNRGPGPGHESHDRGAVPVLPGGGGDRPHPGAGGPAGRGGGGAAVLLRGFPAKGRGPPAVPAPGPGDPGSWTKPPSPGCWGTS